MHAPEARFAVNVIENARGELLLLERSRRAALGPGLWGFPAGHLKGDESPEACAQRELAEEIGGEVQVELIGRCGPVRDTQYGGRFEIWLFHYRWRGGRVRLNEEHTAWAWVAPGRLAELPLMPGVEEDLALLGLEGGGGR